MYTKLTNILEIESEIRRKKNNMLNSKITKQLEIFEKLMKFRAFKDIF